MKFCVQLILVVSTTVQISCRGSQFIQMPLSWFDANQFCKDQNSSLACITPEDISNTNLQDGQKFWIPTHTTFSSWIKHAGYITQEPNGTKFVIPEDDIFTCQIHCSGYKLFIVNATKCLCFSDYSKTRLNGSVKVYESVDESELNVHFNWVSRMPCDYYICTEQFPEQFLKPDGVDNECFTPDRFLVICSSSEINIQHQQRCRLLNTFENQVRQRNVVCKLFLVEVIYDNKACGFNGNGIGQGCNVAYEAGYNFVKGVGLTSFLNKDKTMISCYSGMISIYNDVQTMTFSDTMDCNFNSSFFCEKDVRKLGLCELNLISTNGDTAYTTSAKPLPTTEVTTDQGDNTTTDTSTDIDLTTRKINDIPTSRSTDSHLTSEKELTSVQRDDTTTKTSTKMDLTTSKINYTPTGGSTDSHQTSDKGVMVGLIVGICLFMFVIAGVFILIYCRRIKHKKLKQNQSNIFAIRNVAYESDSLNITNNINERNANRFDYDHIKEQEYATIEPDTDEKYQSIAAPLSHNNKALFSKPRLKKNQDSAYSAINKSEIENEYDELKVINNTNTQESEKDRPRIGYGKTHKNCLILENDNNRCSMPCDKTSKTNTNEYVEAGIVTNNFQHNNLQPQVNHDYLMLESEYSNVKTDEGNKTSQYMPDNYFILEKFDTALSNNQTEEFDKEGDYVDSPECDYDHLHKKKQRKSQENEHFNLYSHLGPDSENENTYDTSRSFQTGPYIDSNAYDTCQM